MMEYEIVVTLDGVKAFALEGWRVHSFQLDDSIGGYVFLMMREIL